MKGPCGVVVAEGAGGLEAIAHARRTIRRGVDTIVGGGVEAPIGPYALTCQLGTGYLSTERAGRRLPTVRQGRQRLRPRRGRRDPADREQRPRRAARRASRVRGDSGLRRDPGRPPLGPPGARRTPARARDLDRPHGRGHRASRRSTPCAPTPSACPRSTRSRWRRSGRVFGEHAAKVPDNRPKVDGRAHCTRAARRSTWRRRCWRCATGRCARPSTSTSRPAASSTS